MTKGFKSTMRKGFKMTFANGLTASVQWGAGNYCDNHLTGDSDLFHFRKDAESSTAEVAIFANGNTMLDLSVFVPVGKETADYVCGWLTPDEVVDFLFKVKNARVVNPNANR